MFFRSVSIGSTVKHSVYTGALPLDSSEGLLILSGLLRSSRSDLGWTPPTICFNGETLNGTDVLGAGATSIVYRFGEMAGKCSTKHEDLENESNILRMLESNSAGLFPKPLLFERGVCSSILLLSPIAERFITIKKSPSGGLIAQGTAHFLKLDAIRLFRALNLLHQLGYVSRDVRPDNVVKGQQGLILIDLAFATKEEEPCVYQGTVRHASPSVLQHLQSDPLEDYKATREDDLHAAVRTIFALYHSVIAADIPLATAGSAEEFENIECFWGEHLREGIWARMCDVIDDSTDGKYSRLETLIEEELNWNRMSPRNTSSSWDLQKIMAMDGSGQ